MARLQAASLAALLHVLRGASRCALTGSSTGAEHDPPSARYPSTTIVYCDGPANDGQHVWPGPPVEWCGANNPYCVASQSRHSGGINFTLADFHAKWYRVEQLKTTVDSSDAKTDTLASGNLRKPRNDGQNPWWRL